MPEDPGGRRVAVLRRMSRIPRNTLATPQVLVKGLEAAVLCGECTWVSAELPSELREPRRLLHPLCRLLPPVSPAATGASHRWSCRESGMHLHGIGH